MAQKNNNSVENKAKMILKEAQQKGTADDPFFITTYHLLEVQIDMLSALEKSFKEEGTTITKEYVKGRENICIHPAVDKYSKVSDSAVNKILKLKELIDRNSGDNDNESFDDDDL